MEKNESAVGRQSAPGKCSASVLLEKHSSSARFASQLKDCSQNLVDSVARQNLASAIEHGSGRRSLSESLVVDPNFPPTNTSLRKQFDHDEEYNTDLKMDKNSDESSFPRVKHSSFISLVFLIYITLVGRLDTLDAFQIMSNPT